MRTIYRFVKCSYEELQVIRKTENLLLSGWGLLEKEYIDETRKIYSSTGDFLALINYYFIDEKKCKMCIALFEVFADYRKCGHGKSIIEQFLDDYWGEVEVLPSGVISQQFWEKCGFEGGCYLDRR